MAQMTSAPNYSGRQRWEPVNTFKPVNPKGWPDWVFGPIGLLLKACGCFQIKQNGDMATFYWSIFYIVIFKIS